MRVSIVGASGNLDSAFVRLLAAGGGNHVVGVSRRFPAMAPAFASVRSWRHIDVGGRDAEQRLVGVFAGADAVVNFAWGFQPTRYPGRLHRTGVVGSERVVRAAAATGVAHVVQTSSVAAYSERVHSEPVVESFPRSEVPGSVYSEHKVAAEVALGRWDEGNPGRPVITGLRPGFLVQPAAGSALLRYGLPRWLPGWTLKVLPVLPLDPAFVIPVVHADDVAAAAAARMLHRRPSGPFNVAAERAITRGGIADILHARAIDIAPRALETLVQATGRAQVQPRDGGWIRVAYSVPPLDSGPARTQLDWRAEHDPVDALLETIQAMRNREGTGGPVLRPRSFFAGLPRLLRSGPISRRELP